MLDQEAIERARAAPIEHEINARHIKLKRVGSGEFAGPCPKCGGTDRFSINTVQNIWNCRQCRGNTTGDVIGLVRHLDGCSFEEAVSRLAGEPARKPNGNGHPDAGPEPPAHGRASLGQIAAVHDYTDEAGALLFQVLRYEPKDFRQRRPDGRGGWIANTDGVRVVPYRLPDLLEAVERGQTVWIVEGEKDADRLWSLGYPATTNPRGAGNWKPELDRYFSGADVVVVGDNDPQARNKKTGELLWHSDGRPRRVGQDHAEAVAGRLEGLAEKVRLIDLGNRWKECPEKGDISDYLDAGLAIDDLLAPNHKIKPEQYVWTNPEEIPVREWIYGYYLIRKFVSFDVARPGIGKTSHAIAEALAMITGRPLLGIRTAGRLRVWMQNLEDPRIEFDRRIQAACKHYGISKEEIEGRLFVTHGRETPICIASTTRDGTVINEPDVDAIVCGATNNKIDAIFADPFVSSHSVTENDNNAIDAVVKQWGCVAEKVNCAVRLTHHTRKGDLETTVDSARGGSAIIGASRVVRVFNQMSKEEAEKIALGDDSKRKRYYRVDVDKQNMAPPAESSSWYEIVSVCLLNGPDGAPGDYVGVTVPWIYPKPLDGITGRDFELVAAAIRAGRWRKDVRAKDWVGEAVADALRMDLEDVADKAKIKGMIKAWLAAGSLVVVERYGQDRHVFEWIEVNEQQ